MAKQVRIDDWLYGKATLKDLTSQDTAPPAASPKAQLKKKPAGIIDHVMNWFGGEVSPTQVPPPAPSGTGYFGDNALLRRMRNAGL